MAASFNIDYPGSPNEFVVNANKAISIKGGIFTGDQKAGNFSLKTAIGSIKGTYQVLPTSTSATKVSVTILQKPMLVPMSTIQKTIEGYF